MACVLEIRKTIENSIDKKLPNKEAVMSQTAAKSIRDYLNTLWSSAITRIAQYSADGGYKVIVNSLDDAVSKEFKRQVEAEKMFERDLSFFMGDVALMEQEKRQDSFYQERGRALQALFSEDFKNLSSNQIESLQNTFENVLQDTNPEDLGIKGGQVYSFLSEKDAEKFNYLTDKQGGFPKEFQITKQITRYEQDKNNPLKFNPLNEFADFQYIKANNNKKSNLYNVINTNTGEIVAEKVRVLSTSKDVKSEIADKYGVNFKPTKIFSADRSISFALYRQKPSKAKYVAQAKKYLYDALKFLNKEESSLNINLDKIEEFLDAFPEGMWDYINTTYSPEDTKNINASISLQNYIKFSLPKLGILQEIEKSTGIPLLGVSFKNYDRTGKLEKLFKYSKEEKPWGETITIDPGNLTRTQLEYVISYYLKEKGYFTKTSVGENVRKYAEHHNQDYEELQKLVFGDTDLALKNIAYNNTGNSDEIELAKWRDRVINYDWQSVELFQKPYQNFNERVKTKIIEKFKDKSLSNNISHLDYFFSGNFNWMNINFNNISGQYYKEDMENAAPVGVFYSTKGIINPFEVATYTKPKAGEHFLKEEEVFNRLASILHEPFHALHALSYGTSEEKNLRKAFESLKNTAFGAQMMKEVFGDGYNGQDITDDVLYKEFTAFTTQLMLYPKEWITKTDLRSNDIYDFIEKVQNLQDKTYSEIVTTKEKIGEETKITTTEEQIKLNFLEKLYNYVVKALHNVIPLSKQFFDVIADSKLVSKSEIEDVFQETEHTVTKTVKLPENVKKAQEDFLQKMDELKNAINTLMQIDSALFNPRNINKFFSSSESYNQESNTEQKPENENIIYQQKNSETVSSPASKETIQLVRDFLKRIGVKTELVKEMVIDGKKLDDNGIANITKALIKVLESKEATTLPEEAMHFAVEIIQQTDPKLFNKLIKEINNYAIYKTIAAEYGTDPDYQTKDGKPDILKLKKEAIGKVLAEVLIKKMEGSTEKLELLQKVTTWWEDIIQKLKSLVVKSGFDQLSLNIIKGKNIGTVKDIVSKEGNIYKQNSGDNTQQAKIFDSIREASAKISKVEDGYKIGDRKVKTRVSDLVSSWYERRFRNNDLTKSEYQEEVDALKAEKGTAGHAAIEYAFKLFVDENGYLREFEQDDDDYEEKNPGFPRDLYEILKDNLRDRLHSFPKENGGTRFMSEATVYDPKRDIAGTVDFLAIDPEGKVSILDWKFMDLNIDKYSDIPWYKIGSWRTQMDQYKYIISKVYGVKPENFNQTMMVPIKAHYSETNHRTKVLPELLNVEIGDVNIKNIKDDYLIPVGVENQTTGNEKIDELIEKLNAVYKKLSEQKVTLEEKQSKAEQLNALFYAIRQLQMKQNIEPLIYQAKILNKQIQNAVNKYNREFKGVDPKVFTERQISEFSDTLETLSDALGIYAGDAFTEGLDIQLGFMFGSTEDLSPEDQKLKNELREAIDLSRNYKDVLKKLDKEFTTTFIGGTSAPEKIIKGIARMFGTTATIQLKALATLYKKANKAFALAGFDTFSEIKTLTKIKDEYQLWAQAKGLTIKNQFDILKKKNKNELIDEFNPEFYTTLKQKIQDNDFAWIRANVDVDAYKVHLEKVRKEEAERINAKPRVGTEQEIDMELTREKERAFSLYTVNAPDSVGWLIYDEISKFPKREKWESKEWVELNKPENAPAKTFYDYIKERNEYYRSIGYINAKQARVFLPWVRQGLAEKMIFGGNISLGEQFLRNISIDEGDIGYGKTDPLSGQLIDTIPIYLTKDIGEDYSTDLFKTMALYNEFAIKFKYLSDIEAQARALVRLEKNKKAIATSMFGRTEYKNGVIQLNPDNSENSKLVQDMVKAIIYQQKYIQSETFDQLLGSVGNLGAKINKKLGKKIFAEDLQDRQLSINKVITQLNNTFQLNALGLNILSSLSNLFGGKTQAFINSGKFFTKKDFVDTELWLLANKMQGPDKLKKLAALEYFLPFVDNYNRHAITKLSLTKVNSESVQNFLMGLMRESEQAVQVTNFFCFLKNSIIQDGEIINTREYLRSTDEYKNFYQGTQEERDARAEKFEKDVEELNEKQGVFNLSTVVDGQFVIPGIDQKSDTVIDMRRMVQSFTADALGSMSEDNKRIMNMTVYGNSMMLFKNWIPRLVDVRMGNIKYNSASDAYEWGRTRMIARIFLDDIKGSLGNLKNSLVANEKGVEYLRQLYEKKKDDYERDTGKTLEMTEDQFIDLARQNIRNQLFDLLALMSMWALYLGLKALAPDDDGEDPAVKNQWKFMLKATDKFKDEIGYFYDPTSIAQLFGKGIFPSLGLIENYGKVLENFMIENYALAVGDEKLEEKTHVIKYLMKSFPISSQAAAVLPMFLPNVAKDLGMRIQSKYGF